jgi:uracil-DNA glycosylase
MTNSSVGFPQFYQIQQILDRFLGKRREKTLTATIKNFRAYLPTYFPIVHPSPLNYGWVNRNPWFMAEVVPALRERVAQLMK